MSENLARLSDRRESFRDCQCFRVANFIFHLRASVSPTLPSPPPPECNAMNIIGQHKRDHHRGPSFLKPTPLWLVCTYASECQSCVTQIFAFLFFLYFSAQRQRREKKTAAEVSTGAKILECHRSRANKPETSDRNRTCATCQTISLSFLYFSLFYFLSLRWLITRQ
jgi:hypothetical protein